MPKGTMWTEVERRGVSLLLFGREEYSSSSSRIMDLSISKHAEQIIVLCVHIVDRMIICSCRVQKSHDVSHDV